MSYQKLKLFSIKIVNQSVIKIILHVTLNFLSAAFYCQRKSDIVLVDDQFNKTYFLVSVHLNWTKAERLCWANYNGTLLSIDSEEEHSFVSNVLSLEPFVSSINNQSVWTGLFQFNDQWRWPECKKRPVNICSCLRILFTSVTVF